MTRIKRGVIESGKPYYTKLPAGYSDDELSSSSLFGSAEASSRDGGEDMSGEFLVSPGSADSGGEDNKTKSILSRLLGSSSESEEEIEERITTHEEEDRYKTLAERKAESAAADPGLSPKRPSLGKGPSSKGGGLFR